MTDSDVAASPAPKPAKPKFSWRVWAVVSMFGAIAYALMFSTAEGKPFPLAMLVPFSIFGGAMVGFIYYGLFHVLRVFFYSTREGQNAQKAAETLQDQLDTDFVTNLVKIKPPR